MVPSRPPSAIVLHAAMLLGTIPVSTIIFGHTTASCWSAVTVSASLLTQTVTRCMSMVLRITTTQRLPRLPIMPEIGVVRAPPSCQFKIFSGDRRPTVPRVAAFVRE